MKHKGSVHLLRLYGLISCLQFGRCSGAGITSQSLRGLNTDVVGRIEGLYLIDADTDLPIQLLRNGSVIDIAMRATSNFNIEARTIDGTVGSIRFGYNNNANYRTENGKPFTFCGNAGTNFFACSILALGEHTIKATPFFNRTARIPAGTPLQVTFTIIDSRTSPTKAPTKAPTYAPISCTRPQV